MSALHRTIASLACLFGVGVAAPMVQAEPKSERDSPRKESRTISNTTAWVPKAGELNLELGIDQETRPTGSISIGLGNIAELGVQLQNERSECDPCGDPSKDAIVLNVASAFFKMGTPEGLFYKHVPAFAIVFRKALLIDAQVFTDAERVISDPLRETRGAMLTAMSSKTLGPAAVHLGAEVLVSSGTALQGNFGVDEYVIRPALAAQWTPSQYPLSTFLVDLRWVPKLEEENQSHEWSTRMTAAWGVRYQALEWASVDLNVRRQDGQGLGDALVTLGVRGHFDLSRGDSKKRGQGSLSD